MSRGDSGPLSGITDPLNVAFNVINSDVEPENPYDGLVWYDQINNVWKEWDATGETWNILATDGATVPDPTGLADGVMQVIESEAWVAREVLSGVSKIAVVAELPDPQVAGTLYLVTE